MKKRGKNNNIRKEFRNRMFIAISSAFALVIALTWNDAIRGAVDKLLEIMNVQTTTYLYKIIAAIIITFICVIGILIASKRTEK